LDVDGTARLRQLPTTTTISDVVVADADGVLHRNTAITGGGGDADWHETPGTAPDDINDDIYTHGKVGIGIDNPSVALHVKGTAPVLRLDAGNNYLELQGNSSTAWIRTSGTGIGILFSQTSNFMELRQAVIRNIAIAGQTGYEITAHPSQTVNIFEVRESGGPPGNLFVIDSDGDVGIGTPTPEAKLDVRDGTVLFEGTTGVTPVSGLGTRMMWIPAKAALRAGTVGSSHWDDVNIGQGSVALGLNTTASKDASVAIGHGNTASGFASLALGLGTNASGDISTAMGLTTRATNEFTTAMGASTAATGKYSTATGNSTIAQSVSSFVVGQFNVPIGNIAIDQGANALFIVGNGINNARSNAFVVRRDGHVGIGTNIPSRQLHVNGDMRLTAALYDGNNQPGNADYILTSTVTGVNWVDIATLDGDWLVTGQSMVSIPTGNVGIGFLSGTAKLAVDGDFSLSSFADREIFMETNQGIGKHLTIHSTDIDFPTEEIDPIAIGGDLILRGGNVIHPGGGGNVFAHGGIGTAPNRSGHVFLAHDGTNAVGNVGIGTMTPTAKLEVHGNILLTSDADREIGMKTPDVGGGVGNNLTIHSTDMDIVGSGGKLILRGGNGDGPQSVGGDVFVYGGIGVDTSLGNVILAHSGSSARGKVGIGTPSPLTTLHVAGKTVFAEAGITSLSPSLLTPTGVQIYQATGGSSAPSGGEVALIVGDLAARSILFSPHLGGAHYNQITQNGDLGIIFRNGVHNEGGSGFVIAPQSAAGAQSGIRITPDGSVHIGKSITSGDHVDFKLAVDGKIVSTSIWVTLDGWGDYVLKPDYQLMPLNEKKLFIKEYGYLPGMLSESEFLENGMNLAATDRMQQIVIEENVLHVIDHDERIEKLEEEIKQLKQLLNKQYIND
ncbi:MAG TPA: hypothetical protein EYN51_12130, partial [Flavobacteriales bacterium]|nr:hypothetical protein [Flavobacteriales bacterium]